MTVGADVFPLVLACPRTSVSVPAITVIACFAVFDLAVAAPVCTEESQPQAGILRPNDRWKHRQTKPRAGFHHRRTAHHYQGNACGNP